MTQGTKDAIVSKIDSIPDCVLLQQYKDEVFKILNDSLDQLKKQLETFEDLILDSNPAVFIAKMINTIAKSIEDLKVQIENVTKDLSDITDAILNKAISLSCTAIVVELGV